MKLQHWSIYRVSDGALTDRKFGSTIPGHLPSVPPGHAAIEGQHDHRSRRVQQDLVYDVLAGFCYDTKVIECPVVKAEHEAVEAIRVRANHLHAQRQRALAEALLALLPADNPARVRIDQIDAELAQLKEKQK